MQSDCRWNMRFAFMKKNSDPDYSDCIDYLIICFKHFGFRWFLDCGEWFIYVDFKTRKKTSGFRLSGAGNMTYSFDNKIEI